MSQFPDPQAAAAAVARLRQDPVTRASLDRILGRLVRACGRSADPNRALVNFERLVQALPNPGILYRYLAAAPDRLEMLVTLFAHSQALADTLTRDARYFHFLIGPAALERPRDKMWLQAELNRWLAGWRAAEDRYEVVRQFRRRETLRIGARDLLGRASVEETILELSNLADVCLQAVYEIALECVSRRYRVPVAATDSGFAIIGMGKLGGQELNYSSDVDLMFVYGTDGELTPQLSRAEFYTRLAEEIVRQLARPGEVGVIYRVDMRLRPEGKSGPLVMSLDDYENYYAERGETWERMALIKARCVAGDTAVGSAFTDMIQPFVYSRLASENVIREMAVLKQRIEREVVRQEELTRHVKLGIGGIREIEFIVQAFQVLRGARVAELRQRQTLQVLPALARHRLLRPEEAHALAEAYRFLRRVEHRLQMERELQTHTVPDDPAALRRLARAMGYESVETFQREQAQHTASVRTVYAAILAQAEAQPVGGIEPEEVVTAVPFADRAAAERTLRHLAQGSGVEYVSERTREIFSRLVPELVRQLQRVADPDAALLRFDKFVSAYGSRGLLYEILGRHPRLLEMLVRVGDASRFLSEMLVRRPELFDAVGRGEVLSDPKTVERMLEELRAETDEPMQRLRRWKQTELFRIGAEDVMGLADVEQVQAEISRLATAAVRFSLEQVQTRARGKRPGFAVIAMGKFGGQELGYGADLDVMFVGDGTDAIAIATDLIRFLQEPTSAGSVFRVDARLRPDGEKGPLAASLEAYRQYYRERAQLWERQALTKARWVAGTETLGRAFIEMVQAYVYERALTEEELAEIRRMRRRIERERCAAGREELEFKTGPGGLMDVEFLVQALQLRFGADHPQVRTAHTLAALNRLTALGALTDQQSYWLRRGYLLLRRVEMVLRREEDTSVSALPAEAPAQKKLAQRLGFADINAFMRAYRTARGVNRSIFEDVCGKLPV